MHNFGITIATLSYLVLALATLFDKFLVTKTFRSPYAYTFWLGTLSVLAFLLLPLQFAIPPSPREWLLDFIAGAAFTFSILFYMRGLNVSDASSALPVVGVMSTVLTGLLSFVFVGERLTAVQLASIAILLLGFWVLTAGQIGITKGAVSDLLLAAIFFSVSNVTMKVILTSQPFISGLAFSRIGAVAAAAGLLLLPAFRQEIFRSKTILNLRSVLIALFGNGLGAMGMLGIWFAYRFSSPTILNAMQGVQYGFLFILAWLTTYLWPKLIAEQTDRKALIKKIAGIVLVMIGLIVLQGGGSG